MPRPRGSHRERVRNTAGEIIEKKPPTFHGHGRGFLQPILVSSIRGRTSWTQRSASAMLLSEGNLCLPAQEFRRSVRARVGSATSRSRGGASSLAIGLPHTVLKGGDQFANRHAPARAQIDGIKSPPNASNAASKRSTANTWARARSQTCR